MRVSPLEKENLSNSKGGPLWKKCFLRAKETPLDILRCGHRNPYQLENTKKKVGQFFAYITWAKKSTRELWQQDLYTMTLRWTNHLCKSTHNTISCSPTLTFPVGILVGGHWNSPIKTINSCLRISTIGFSKSSVISVVEFCGRESTGASF